MPDKTILMITDISCINGVKMQKVAHSLRVHISRFFSLRSPIIPIYLLIASATYILSSVLITLD
jgi:hypothetical protein